MSDASFEGIRGGDGRRRTWRSDIMTTPPPVYESPRWLPPPIASTEGGRRLVNQTLGRRSRMPCPIFGARARRTQTPLPLPSGARPLTISARFRVWKLPTRSRVHTREHGDGRRSTPHSRHRADTMPTRARGGRDEHLQNKKWLRDQKSYQNQTQMKKYTHFSRLRRGYYRVNRR